MFKPEDLPPLASYRATRLDTRAQATQARSKRRLHIDQNVVLLFENKTTIYFQIMEMLHIEHKDSRAAREEELMAYNPLISDANNLKATMQIEYTEVEERNQKLIMLKDIERHMWWRVGDCKPVYGIADEDMERSDENKTSAVHFLRYPIDKTMRAAASAPWVFGCDHPHYNCDSGDINKDIKMALMEDLSLKQS